MRDKVDRREDRADRDAKYIEQFSSELEREINKCLPGEEKTQKETEKPNKIAEMVAMFKAMEEEQDKLDMQLPAYFVENKITAADQKKIYDEREMERETARIRLLRGLKVEREKELQKKCQTVRARDPMLYRSQGLNSILASNRRTPGNKQQVEADPKPWNAWQVEKPQFLLSASRSIGMLRASRRSTGFRFDAFQSVCYS